MNITQTDANRRSSHKWLINRKPHVTKPDHWEAAKRWRSSEGKGSLLWQIRLESLGTEQIQQILHIGSAYLGVTAGVRSSMLGHAGNMQQQKQFTVRKTLRWRPTLGMLRFSWAVVRPHWTPSGWLFSIMLAFDLLTEMYHAICFNAQAKSRLFLEQQHQQVVAYIYIYNM